MFPVVMTLALLSGAPAAEALSEPDREAILRAICDGTLVRSPSGIVCRGTETDHEGVPFESRWLGVWRGRFVARADEWLVSLAVSCTYRFCPGEAYVVRRVEGRWRREHTLEVEAPIRADCSRLVGIGGALDRLVCHQYSGPHQGYLSERLVLLSFAGAEESVDVLMRKDQGGECFVDDTSGREHHADELTLPSEAPADPKVVLNASLAVWRAPCPASIDEEQPAPVLRSTHALRFVEEDGRVRADAATAAVLRAHGWEPGEEGGR